MRFCPVPNFEAFPGKFGFEKLENKAEKDWVREFESNVNTLNTVRE